MSYRSGDTREVNGHFEWFNEQGVQTTINGVEIGSEEITPGSLARAWKAFWDTDAGEQFAEEFSGHHDNDKKLLDIFLKLYPDGLFVPARMVDAAQTGIMLNEFRAEPEEAAELPERDEQGRFVDRQGELRAEIRRILADPTIPAASLRQRAAKDEEFRLALEAEMQVAPAARPIVPIISEDRERLGRFALDWKREPSPRFLAGYMTIAGTRYTKAEIDLNLDGCAKLGLL